jgi:tripartite-type tricarboxylate transporter receptor subunit TctC
LKSRTHSTSVAADVTPGMSRRNLLGLCAAAAVSPSLVLAQDYPSKPIRIVVGATPGGSIDAAARIVSTQLSESLRTPVIVENRPGAAGVLATDFAVKASPDGYTLLVGTPSPIIIAPQAMTNVKFNPLTDLAAINMVSTSPIAIAVYPGLGVRSLKDLVALSRKRPVTMGLPLAGSVSHLVVEMAAKALGINFLNVPYKGAAPAMNDAIAGHIDATVADAGVLIPMHEAGRLRIVMVTPEKRMETLPDVAAASEDVPGFVVTNWIGVFAPAKTPTPVVDKVNAVLVKCATRDDVRAQFRKLSAQATAMPSPHEFQKLVATEYARYGQLVRERGIVISE